MKIETTHNIALKSGEGEGCAMRNYEESSKRKGKVMFFPLWGASKLDRKLIQNTVSGTAQES